MDGELREVIEECYSQILQSTNAILSNCKQFSIEILKLEDPSYEEIADQLTKVCRIIDSIADAHPQHSEGVHTAAKASEYTKHIIIIAKAIRAGDEEALQREVTLLDKRPFI